MDNRQYLQMFFDESSEYIQILNENVLALERDTGDKEIINKLFRAAHSLKGMAATMGFEVLTDLTHKIENILDSVRNDKLLISDNLINLLFNGLDYITELIDNIKKEGKESVDVSVYIDSLTAFLKDGVTYAKSRIIAKEENDKIIINDDETKDIRKNMKNNDKIFKIEVILKEDSVLKNVRGYMVLKKAQELGFLFKSIPEMNRIEDEDFGFIISLVLISDLSSTEIKGELKNIIDIEKVVINEYILPEETDIEKENKRDNLNKNRTSSFDVSPTVRVDIKKLDNLMNMVGELLINKTRLEGLNIQSDIYTDILQQLDRVTMELHHIVMQIRMVPIGGIFNRFPRMVRDLSKDLSKKIDLLIEGADTELDRSIIDELADPLIHILRNAIDHGIETPDIRKKKGKDEIGTILLKAYQKGSEIIIEVEDDGIGLDPDKIVNTAIDKGIISQDEAENIEDREKLNFIFNPGFSTSEEVTDISGRGVGMDVVRKVVESLDGHIFLESEIDVGTRFTISLPLTLAITQALMLKINNEIFAIPLGNISEAIKIKPEDIRQVRGQDVIVIRNSTIPIVEGSKQLNFDVEYGKYKNMEEIPVVIINSGERQIGLIVDELLNQQEIVIKSLGKYLVNTKNISGATIVGDGDVALILDVRNIA